MHSQGVSIQVDHPVFGTAKGSGLQINNIVVAHGALLAPLCFQNNNDQDYCNQYNMIMKELQSMQSFIFKTGRDGDKSKIKFKVLSKGCNRITLNIKHCDSNSRPTFIDDHTVKEAVLCLLHNCKELANIRKEISNWSYNDSFSESGNQLPVLDSLVLSTFLFLVVGEPSEDVFEDTLQYVYNTVKNNLIYPGLPLIVESTPFGNFSFTNSWSHGIISKVLGSDNQGILTDARLVSGCEGAPIYILEDGKKSTLVGLVIQTIAWCNGEWVGFSLGINVKHLLKNVLGLESTMDYIPFDKLQMDLPSTQVNIDQLALSIVFVQCGHKWGSGVVIDDAHGIILTCSHIIDHAPDSVFVLCEGGRFPAAVVYATPLSVPYDLAVLSIGKVPGLKQLPLAENPPILGEHVVTAGYPLSTESLVSINRTPTLSAGCVAKLSEQGGPLQTTCCTQSGVSGGALIRPPRQLLGIVVSNVQLDSTTLPSFSFVVSIDDIREPLQQYLQTQDPYFLQTLNVDRRVVRVKWALLDCKL